MKKEGRKTLKKVKQEIFFNIPNSITLLRLILIFVFIYMLFNNFSKLSLIIIFAIAASSDWFDGFFARKLKQTTKIGARMDQVVDRIFTIMIVGSLVFFSFIHYATQNIFLLLVLTISREIIGFPGFLIILIRGKSTYRVKYIGKATTFVQSITLGAIILGVSWAIYLSIITCIIGIFSGFDYLKYSLS